MFFRHIIIFATAYGGSYLFVRSFGSIIGNYPNEFDIAEDMKNKKISAVRIAKKCYYSQ